MSLPLNVLPSPQMWTSSSFIASTSIVPVTARPMRRRVEVGHAGGGDVEGAALQRREPFGHELRAAVDQPRLLGAVLERLARDVVVVGLVRLPQVGGVGVGNRALCAHPVKRGARIEAAGKRDADSFADGNPLENCGHAISNHN